MRTKVKQGDVFNKLTVLDTFFNGRSYANCVCVCKKHTTVAIDKLKSGRTKSCGCFKSLKLVESNVNRSTHKMTLTPTYRTWQNMKKRCLDPNDSDFKNYGARGITVCERWLSFENFFCRYGS